MKARAHTADCGSKGLSARELKEHELWWKGPPWLWQDPIAVPRHPQTSDLVRLQDEDARPSVCLVVSATQTVWFEHRYSSYRTLLHGTAWVQRAAHHFISFIRERSFTTGSCLSVADIKSAEVFLLKSSQR